MSDRFARGTEDRRVRHDIRLLGDFVSIYCDGHHADGPRHVASTPAMALGVYGRRKTLLCGECEAHLAYAEERRAFCPKDPKPFCAHCETHCYKPDEAAWQRQMMRFSGRRSWRRGHAIDGIKHMLEARRVRRALEARRTAEAADAVSE